MRNGTRSPDPREPGESPRRSRSRFGLRARLLLLTLPVVNFVFVAIWLVVTTTARDGVLSLSRANLQLAANSIGDALEQAIADSYTDAAMAARLDVAAEAIDSRNPKNLAWFADELVRSKKRYAAIVLTDLKGAIIGSNTVGRGGGRIPSLAGRSLGAEPWARELLGRDKTAPVVRVPLSRPGFLASQLADNEQVLGFALPVADVMGERIGTLCVLLSSHYLAELLSAHVVRVGGTVDSVALITDAAGKVAVFPTELVRDPAWRHSALSINPRLEVGDQPWMGPGNTAFLFRRRHVASAAQTWGFRIVALQTLARLEAPVQSLSRRLFVAFFIGVFLTTAILILVATRFVGPIRRLTAAASRDGRAADFEAIRVESMDEVGVLTDAYNRLMANLKEYQHGLEAKVEQRTRELAHAKAEVTDILDNMQEAIFTIGADQIVNKQFSAASRQVFGEVEIAGRKVWDLLQLDRHPDQEARSRMSFWLRTIFGTDELQWMLAESDRVGGIIYRRPTADGTDDRTLQLEYAPVYEQGALSRVMIIAKDVTEVRRLHARSSARRRTTARTSRAPPRSRAWIPSCSTPSPSRRRSCWRRPRAPSPTASRARA